MANKYIKICSISLLIREIEIKITMKEHFLPISLGIIKKKIWIRSVHDVEKLECLSINTENVNWYRYCRKYFGGTPKRQT